MTEYDRWSPLMSGLHQKRKVLHLADTHIGMENYGRINPETGLNQRLHDFLRSLDQAIDTAVAEKVDLVVFAGDIYKTRDPTPTHQREFAQRIQRLSSAGIQSVIVAGNHDIPMSVGRASSVDIFRALQIPNVTVARSIATHRVQTASGPIQVLTFPWTARSMVLAQADFKNRTLEELNQAMIDLNTAKLRQEAEALDPDVPAMVVGHTHVFGAKIGAERLLTMGSDPMYDLQMFDLPHVDYVGLGHIHKHQALAYATPVVYSGSIDRVDFGEEAESKGFVLVELGEKGRAEWEFRTVDARPFLTIEARVESDNATQDVVRAIAREAHRLENAVVRLRIDVPPERAPELNDDEIRRQLKGAYYIAPVERTSPQRVRSRWGAAAAAIQRAGPLEALTLYLEHQRVDPERRDVLLRYARQLMEPEAEIGPECSLHADAS
ncbi:MAG: exonuclease SbcCD subunit D [Chloroflexi bacterium]|nr:exonuclease SbcCD subunit D [Chloroflexota bacterium]